MFGVDDRDDSDDQCLPEVGLRYNAEGETVDSFETEL
jgi:hypothetical protein